jgi:hypothetical protein
MWLGGRLKLDQQAVFPEDRGSNRGNFPNISRTYPPVQDWICAAT